MVRREKLQKNSGVITQRCDVANRKRPHKNSSKFEDELEKRSKVLSLILDMLNLNCPWDFPLDGFSRQLNIGISCSEERSGKRYRFEHVVSEPTRMG